MSCSLSLKAYNKNNDFKTFYVEKPSKELIEKFFQESQKEKLKELETNKESERKLFETNLKFAKKWWKK